MIKLHKYPKITIENKTYAYLPNHDGVTDEENINYIMVYRKYYYVTRYDDVVLNCKHNLKQRFSTYRVIERTTNGYICEKGNVEWWKYQWDGEMYKATRFVKKSNKLYSIMKG